MSAGRSAPFFLAELCKAKPVKFVRILIDSFVRLSGTSWEGDERAWGNSNSIGKCERLQHEPGHDNWRKVWSEHQQFVIGTLGRNPTNGFLRRQSA